MSLLSPCLSDKICLCSPLDRSVKILLNQIFLFSPLVEAMLKCFYIHHWPLCSLFKLILLLDLFSFPTLCQLGFVCGRLSVDRLSQTRWHQASLGPTLVERGGVPCWPARTLSGCRPMSVRVERRKGEGGEGGPDTRPGLPSVPCTPSQLTRDPSLSTTSQGITNTLNVMTRRKARGSLSPSDQTSPRGSLCPNSQTSSIRSLCPSGQTSSIRRTIAPSRDLYLHHVWTPANNLIRPVRCDGLSIGQVALEQPGVLQLESAVLDLFSHTSVESYLDRIWT